MKRKTVALTSLVTLAAVLVTQSASAIPSQSLRGDVASAVGSGGQVNVSIDGGTVTLTGHVDNALAAQAARRAVLDHGEYNEVIDLILRS